MSSSCPPGTVNAYGDCNAPAYSGVCPPSTTFVQGIGSSSFCKSNTGPICPPSTTFVGGSNALCKSNTGPRCPPSTTFVGGSNALCKSNTNPIMNCKDIKTPSATWTSLKNNSMCKYTKK